MLYNNLFQNFLIHEKAIINNSKQLTRSLHTLSREDFVAMSFFPTCLYIYIHTYIDVTLHNIFFKYFLIENILKFFLNFFLILIYPNYLKNIKNINLMYF